MYSGMADVAALTGDASYINAIDKIWEDVVGKKLYITGGIGATGSGEAFGKAFELLLVPIPPKRMASTPSLSPPT